jgi:hypothetical protein
MTEAPMSHVAVASFDVLFLDVLKSVAHIHQAMFASRSTHLPKGRDSRSWETCVAYLATNILGFGQEPKM